MNEPIKSANEGSYRYKLCKCSECGIETICEPYFDFYVRPKNEETGLLTCENCISIGFQMIGRN